MARTLSRLLSFVELESRDVPVTVPNGFAYFPVVDSGLSSPAALETTPDGRVFVALQNGTIRVVQNDQLLNDPLVVLNPAVDSVWERGLLGITLDPNFASNGHIFVYYTANTPTSHNRISRLTVSGNTVVPGSEVIVYELPDIGGAIYHMGGALQFGNDGKLYVSVGDHQVPASAQSMTSLFGKVLRINKDGTIPTDNPFYNTATGVFRAIWASGLRNPFTKAFDPVSNKLFINDVGNSAWEEINSAIAGSNFGWPTTEGDFTQGTYPNFTRPLYSYSHSGACAITGGAFYSPTTYVFPATYHGKYFFADFCAGWIRTLDPVTAAVGNFATGADYPIDLRVSSSGAIYFITRGAQTGGQPNTGGIGKIAYIDQQAPTITLQPANVLVSTGETATFSVQSAGTPTLTYQWERSLSGTTTWDPVPGATSASLTVSATPLTANGDRYRAVVTNSFGLATSNPATLSVTSNVRPTATITSPVNGSFYNAGQTISFSGLGLDPEDGTLPASAYHWQVDNYTGTIPRPVELPNNGDGYTSGSFVVPTDGIYKPANVYYRIFLTVTDSGGLSKSSFVEIYPNTSVVTVNTQPAGLGLIFDEQPVASPLVYTGVVGFNRTIEAPLFGAIGTSTYQFVSWSDGGARKHVIPTPAANTTYTAVYQPVSATFVSDLPYASTPVNGWGPVERDRSNGETGATDGNTITLQGVTYTKGLGAHANSEVIFNLNGQYSAFLSDVGVDDEVGNNGTVVFQVWVDGVKEYDSGTMMGSSATKSLLVDVTNKNQLRLVVTTAGDGDGSDHADWANARLTVAPTTPPTTPTNLIAQAVSSTQIGIAWNDSSGPQNSIDGYYIERSLNGTTGWTQIATTLSKSYIATGLTAGTTYFFRVRSHNSLGYSAYSNLASSTTNAATIHSIDYSTGFTSGLLSTNGAASIIATSSRLRLSTLGVNSTASSAFFNTMQNIAAFSTTFTYIKSGTSDGMTFTLHRDPRGGNAIGGAGDALGYAAANPITPSVALAINISAAHVLGSQFVSNGVLDFNYTQSNINTSLNNPITVTLTYAAGVLNATLRQGSNVETKSMVVDLPTLLGGSTAYVGFTGGAGTVGSQQEIMYWTFDEGILPATPGNPQATLTGFTASSTGPVPMAAQLTWTAAAGASGYKIERKLTAGGSFAQVGTSTGTSFNDSGLAPGLLYYYRVRANNAVGDSAFTAEIPLATPAAAPAPTNGGVNGVTTNAITIRWTDNADNEDGFQIYRSVDQGPFTLLTAVPVSFAAAPSVVTYTDSGLSPGTRYDYRVQAFNLAGSSSFTSLGTTTATPVPQVQSVQINGGMTQRSRVTSLTVTFNGLVNLAANAFTMERPVYLPTSPLAATLSSAPSAGQGLIAVATSTNGLGQTVATLSFATNSGSTTGIGDGVESGSLSDGTWVLRISGAGVTNGTGTPMAADYLTPATGSGRIHRLFGDADGNANVDSNDFAAFGAGFGFSTGSTGYSSAFDFDENGSINAIDFAQFGSRFALTL